KDFIGVWPYTDSRLPIPQFGVLCMPNSSLSRLPVIVGFGGFNAAGRSSGHQAYKRMVLESLSTNEREQTLAALAVLMGLVKWEQGEYRDSSDLSYSQAQVAETFGQQVLDGTLVRRIEKTFFDVDAAHWQKS